MIDRRAVTPTDANQPDQEVAGRNVLVVGLGRFGGGLGVTRWLCEQGARVTVTDQADKASLQTSVDALSGHSVRFLLGGHDEVDLCDVDLVVVNPAVDRRRHPLFHDIVQRGIATTTEIDLFVERCPGRLIGVTGTAGKSTTCAMLHHVLQSTRPGGGDAWLGGNVGVSLLDDLGRIAKRDWVVLELSSFQLDAMALCAPAFELALITNIRAHHLDRHGDIGAYRNAKLRLLEYVRPGGTVVFGDDGDWIGRAAAMAKSVGAHVMRVDRNPRGYDLRVPGTHNQINARCAATLAAMTGVTNQGFRDAIAGFAGLPHRLEHVARIAGVDYYNDSKSTTPEGTAVALDAVGGRSVVIVGGQDAGDDLSPMIDALRARASHVVCMGPVGRQVAQRFPWHDSQGGRPVIEQADSMADAVRIARNRAAPGQCVVLSPGAPSYDMFTNYAERGAAFVREVMAAADRQELQT